MKVPQDYSYATGRRKSDSAARVWIFKGSGKIQVNGRAVQDYFCREALEMVINQPFDVAGMKGKFDVFCTVRGGGVSGQAEAVRHAIARALVVHNETLKSTLRAAGLITRDSRIVERKKYGRKKARKSFQFSKR